MRTRSTLTFASAVVLALGLAGPAFASPHVGDPPDHDVGTVGTEAPQRTFTYEVQARGSVATSVSNFAATADSILGDARGWTLGGSVAFERVSSGGDFNLVIASPQAVDDAHEVCSPDYSCRVGDDVLINDHNWRNATPAWNETGAPLYQYRWYLINHEVGHFLGFGHFDCGNPGQLAPVMQQQSISLDGCLPNGWPLDFERDILSDDLGVPIYGHTFPDVLASNVHWSNINILAEGGIVSGFGDGYYRPSRSIERGQMATLLRNALGLSADAAPRFDDVSADHTHASGIAAVDEEGIAGGFGDGTFRPGRSVTRAHMATFIARAFGLTASQDPPYTDVDPGDTHAANIAAVTEAGIAGGFGDGTYRPWEPVTRGQIASFLANALDLD
jgi:hypothetical protein